MGGLFADSISQASAAPRTQVTTENLNNNSL